MVANSDDSSWSSPVKAKLWLKTCSLEGGKQNKRRRTNKPTGGLRWDFFFSFSLDLIICFLKIGIHSSLLSVYKKMQFQLGQTHVGSVDDSCSSNLILFYTQERQEAVVWDALLIYQCTVEAPPGSRALSPCNNDKKTEKWWPHLSVIDIKHGDKNYKLLNTTLIQSWREKLNINEVNLKFFICFCECCCVFEDSLSLPFMKTVIIFMVEKMQTMNWASFHEKTPGPN